MTTSAGAAPNARTRLLLEAPIVPPLLRLGGANTFDGVVSAGNTLGTVVLGNAQALGMPSAARTMSFGTTDTL